MNSKLRHGLDEARAWLESVDPDEFIRQFEALDGFDKLDNRELNTIILLSTYYVAGDGKIDRLKPVLVDKITVQMENTISEIIEHSIHINKEWTDRNYYG